MLYPLLRNKQVLQFLSKDTVDNKELIFSKSLRDYIR